MGLDLNRILDASAPIRSANGAGPSADNQAAARFSGHLQDASSPHHADPGGNIPSAFHYLLQESGADAPIVVPVPGQTGKTPASDKSGQPENGIGVPVPGQPGKSAQPVIPVTGQQNAGNQVTAPIHVPGQPGKSAQPVIPVTGQQNAGNQATAPIHVPGQPGKGATITPVLAGNIPVQATPVPNVTGKTGQTNVINGQQLSGLPVTHGKQALALQGAALIAPQPDFHLRDDSRIDGGLFKSQAGKTSLPWMQMGNASANSTGVQSGVLNTANGQAGTQHNAAALLQAAASTAQQGAQSAMPHVAAQSQQGLHAFGLGAMGGFGMTDGFTASGGEGSLDGNDSGDAALDADTAMANATRTGTDKAADGTQLRGSLTQHQAARLGAEAVSRFAAKLAARASKGSSKFEMRMDPPSLGKVEVKLEVTGDNRVHAMLRMEKPETLHDMQREADSLRRSLIAEGYDVPADGLQFSLSDQGGQAWSGFGQELESHGNNHLAAHAMAGAIQEQDVELDTGHGIYRVNDSRVDIRA